jgi:hypothetical protein
MANAIPITFINDASNPTQRIKEIWADITYDNAVIKPTARRPVDIPPAGQEFIVSEPACVHQVRCYAVFFDGDSYLGTFDQQSDYTPQCYTGFDCRIRPPASLKDPLEALELPARTEHALKKNNLQTVQDLTKLKPDEIADLDGIGPSALADILGAASRHQLRFRT